MSSFDLDPAVRPQDDLFRHVNQRWLDSAEIPADKHAAGAFYDLRDASEEAVRDIVTGLSGAEPGTEAALDLVPGGAAGHPGTAKAPSVLVATP